MFAAGFELVLFGVSTIQHQRDSYGKKTFFTNLSSQSHL